MENTSQKLFSPWLILIIVLALGFTFFKTIILNDFEVINTEPQASTTEEVNIEETASTTESVTEQILNNTETGTTTESSTTEPIEAI